MTNITHALDIDGTWLERLKDSFASWNAWAITSNARRSAAFRQMFVDCWIELELAERVIADARTSGGVQQTERATQARAWTLRCIERLIHAISATKGVESWMNDGLEFLHSGRGGAHAEQF